MKEVLPVNKEILKWARVTIGMSEAEVASKIKKTPEDIKEWEAGTSTPTYPMLEKLAYTVYRRPVAVFFFPQIPEEQTPRADFRTLPGEIVDAIPSNIIKMYRRLKTFQLNLAELYEGHKPDTPYVLENFKIDKTTDIPKLAADIRTFLKVPTSEQHNWKTDDVAIAVWRSAFAQCGVFIFKDAFFNDTYSGLCLYDENYPAILINNSMPKTRQIFTIFHELAHLLFNSGGINVPSESFLQRLTGDYAHIEQKCNEFAGELLFPTKEFNSLGVSFSTDSVTELANHYKVSREVVLRKYLTAGQIDYSIYSDFVDQWEREFAQQRSKKTDGGNHYLTKKAYLGETYINLAFTRYFQGKISIDALSDYFGMKTKRISTFEGYALG